MSARLYSNKERPFHLGPLPLERLRRVATVDEPAPGTPLPGDSATASGDAIGDAVAPYLAVVRRHLDGNLLKPTTVPGDATARANNLKAAAYFMDAIAAGCCALRSDDGAPAGHTHALVFLVEFGREPEAGAPGDAWIRGTNTARTDLRASEIAVVLAGYLRALGIRARGHAPGASDVDLARLAVRAGLARVEEGRLVAPCVRRGWRVAAVTTVLELAVDQPLAPDGPLEPDDPAVRLGVGGTRPLHYVEEEARRPLHWGCWPMERIRRVAEPTTLVVEEEIARVPKRGDFFKRAQAGDLGEHAAHELRRFAIKYPLAFGMLPLIGLPIDNDPERSLVPLQGTREPLSATGIGGDLADARQNADAIKALGYYLGADFVGICEAKPWMYYSHDETEGKPIAPYHKYAVVMLIDQGFETMDAASGDDWISCTLSMRAYLRGAEIAGVMAAHCRRMGYSSRVHSNTHSEVIHNPMILMAGLGEVSRIGDTILNPFIGPRSKSVVFTTDLPLTVDQPIDFGLQDFCEQCRKCARECPCDAISFGPKIMFNGYEIWKDDVEKCTRYRVTNQKGAACGRCMKMCPWNREPTAEGERLAWLSIEVPAARPSLIALDDQMGHGTRNPHKRWWFDLELRDGQAVAPTAGTHERDLQLDRHTARRSQRLALYPPDLQPPPATGMKQPCPTDRAAALARYAAAESPEMARARLERD